MAITHQITRRGNDLVIHESNKVIPLGEYRLNIERIVQDDNVPMRVNDAIMRIVPHRRVPEYTEMYLLTSDHKPVFRSTAVTNYNLTVVCFELPPELLL